VVLEQMVYLPGVTQEQGRDDAVMTGWAEALEAALGHVANGHGSRYKVAVRTVDDGAAGLLLTRGQHGIEETIELTPPFFDSPEYRRIVDLGADIADLITEGAYVTRGDQRKEIFSLKEAMNWLMEQAGKGQSVQRYKGLGEMNPEQLWETTINPETRRLTQVRIEDGVAADEIFTTLMGDHVEPRRQFIEGNALTVENLDV